MYMIHFRILYSNHIFLIFFTSNIIDLIFKKSDLNFTKLFIWIGY